MGRASVEDFIKKRRYLIWSVKDFSNISDESVVENTLNYGDFDDVKELISVMGWEEVSSIFKKQVKAKRSNYRPEIANYFKLFFKKYAFKSPK